MRWHEYQPAFRGMAKALGYSGGDARAVAKAVISHLKNCGAPPMQVANTLCEIDNEAIWIENGRPYYDLYPSVAEAFTRVDLSKLKCDQLRLPIPELLVRMPIGQELDLSPETKLRSFLVAEAPASPHAMHRADRGWLISMDRGATIDFKGDGTRSPLHTVIGCLMPDGGTIDESLQRGKAGLAYDQGVDAVAVANAFRIVATLCLLNNDPDLIEPEPLEADRERWEKSHDPALIDKASRRGKRCWAVGKHIEVAPGFRTPHFAIRWMKPRGAATVPTDKPVNREHTRAHLLPVLRPIKGCLVRRKEITDVPTDWLGPEEAK